MYALIAIACAMVVVAVALHGLPRRSGVLAAVAGLATFLAAGYAWVLVIWGVVPRLEPVFAALPGIWARAVFAMVLYFAPPMLAALAVVRLVARAARRDRMAA